MDASAIRHELLSGQSPSLKRRRWIARLAAVGLVDAAAVALNQMHAVKRLPDVPLKGWDTNKVTRAKAAYVFGAPDASLASVLYAVELVLAGFGGTRKTGRRPIFSSLLLACTGAGLFGALGYLADMAFVEKKACPYCFTAAGVCFAMFPLALKDWKERARD